MNSDMESTDNDLTQGWKGLMFDAGVRKTEGNTQEQRKHMDSRCSN